MADDFKQFIDNIRNAADIVEVVESYNIELKRSGAGLKACCPFHNEKTPSFNINPARQSYKCYGCGEGGDAIAFVMKMDAMSFREATEMLANRYNIPIPQFRKTQSDEETRRREAQFSAMETATQFFCNHLTNPKIQAARPALQYLQQRGTTKEVAHQFRIGLSPDNWSGLLDFATQHNHSIETLLKVGLIQERSRGEGYRDRFVGRLMFPIWDAQGRVVAFGGRAMEAGAEPKYLNSPETPLYKKSQTLYAFHFARKEINRRREAIMVEGYFDAIALHQYGFQNAVASCGTALTDEQGKLLRRLCDNVLFLYDADAAGQKAMARGCEILMSHDFGIRVATLPEGEDPDSFLVKNGATAFENYIKEKARDFFNFLVDHYRAQEDDASIHGRIRVVEALASIIAKVPNVIARNEYMRRLASQLGLREGDVQTFLAQQKARQEEKEKQRREWKRAREQATPLGSHYESQPDEYAGDDEYVPPVEMISRVAAQEGDPYQAWERHLLWFVIHSVPARDEAAERLNPDWIHHPHIRILVEHAIDSEEREFKTLPDMLSLANGPEQEKLLADIATSAKEREAGYHYEELDPVATTRELVSRLHRTHLKHIQDQDRRALENAQEQRADDDVRRLATDIHDHCKNRVQILNREYNPLPQWDDVS